jgi:hypothetical protein
MSPLKYGNVKTKYIVLFDGSYKQFVYLVTFGDGSFKTGTCF